jgi:hypothetical protein
VARRLAAASLGGVAVKAGVEMAWSVMAGFFRDWICWRQAWRYAFNIRNIAPDYSKGAD